MINTVKSASAAQLRAAFEACKQQPNQDFIVIPFKTKKQEDKWVKSWWGTSNRTTLKRSKTHLRGTK